MVFYFNSVSGSVCACCEEKNNYVWDSCSWKCQFGPWIIQYLLKFFGNTHACVNSLSTLGVLCFIVLQEVASGELRTDEARQRWIWNNSSTTVFQQGHCLQHLQQRLGTQRERDREMRVPVRKERGGNFSERFHGWNLCNMQRILVKLFMHEKVEKMTGIAHKLCLSLALDFRLNEDKDSLPVHGSSGLTANC